MIRGWALIGAAPARKPQEKRRRVKTTRAVGLKPLLIVMARAPGVGFGKQRLAKDVGRVEALRINRALQAKTFKTVRDPRWRLQLRVTPDQAVKHSLPSVWPRDVPRAAQGEGDLGARLARALKPHRCAAVIGTDCPRVTRMHIASAFQALRKNPFAIGPTEDGGFWILAARRGRDGAKLMRGVRWSSQHTLDDLIGRMPAMPAELVTLRDVDTRDDWRTVGLGLRRLR